MHVLLAQGPTSGEHLHMHRQQFHPYGSPHHSPHRSLSPVHSPHRQSPSLGHTLTVPTHNMPTHLQNFSNQNAPSPMHLLSSMNSLNVTNNETHLGGSPSPQHHQPPSHMDTNSLSNGPSSNGAKIQPKIVISSDTSPVGLPIRLFVRIMHRYNWMEMCQEDLLLVIGLLPVMATLFLTPLS